MKLIHKRRNRTTGYIIFYIILFVISVSISCSDKNDDERGTSNDQVNIEGLSVFLSELKKVNYRESKSPTHPPKFQWDF